MTGSFHSQRPGISAECSQLRLSSSHFRPRPAGAKGACRGHLRNQRDVSQALLWRGTRPAHSSVSRLTPWFLNTPSGSAEPGGPPRLSFLLPVPIPIHLQPSPAISTRNISAPRRMLLGMSHLRPQGHAYTGGGVGGGGVLHHPFTMAQL